MRHTALNPLSCGVEDLYWSFQINSRLRQNVKKQCFCAFTGDNCLEAGLRRDKGRGDLGVIFEIKDLLQNAIGVI